MDNGTEFSGAKLHQETKEQGTVIETTVPHTPEQDGISERSI